MKQISKLVQWKQSNGQYSFVHVVPLKKNHQLTNKTLCGVKVPKHAKVWSPADTLNFLMDNKVGKFRRIISQCQNCLRSRKNDKKPNTI